VKFKKKFFTVLAHAWDCFGIRLGLLRCWQQQKAVICGCHRHVTSEATKERDNLFFFTVVVAKKTPICTATHGDYRLGCQLLDE